MQMLGTVVAILAVVAAADYLFQYRQWYERQKMSLREMKEEFRQTEGDPAIKGKIRQLRQRAQRKRMMAAVPKASVVITNPTHFAVALQYERGMNAPICVAKGADLIARKIREVAEAHDIPIVENPPLARALHGTVEIDQEIPQEHYRAVAEIIGYVMRLRRVVATGQSCTHCKASCAIQARRSSSGRRCERAGRAGRSRARQPMSIDGTRITARRAADIRAAAKR